MNNKHCHTHMHQSVAAEGRGAKQTENHPQHSEERAEPHLLINVFVTSLVLT